MLEIRCYTHRQLLHWLGRRQAILCATVATAYTSLLPRSLPPRLYRQQEHDKARSTVSSYITKNASSYATYIPAEANTGPSGVFLASDQIAMTGAKIPVIRFEADASASPVPLLGVGKTSGA